MDENPASVSYVMAKQKTSNELGFYSIQDDQPATISGGELLKLISKYNKDPKIHCIPVQLPLPKDINETKTLYAIAPKKDVDGFHSVNVGKLTICHTGTKDMASHTKRANILIVAVGKPKAVTAEMVKQGAVVIDVGVNRIGMTHEGKTKLNSAAMSISILSKRRQVPSPLFRAGWGR